MGRERDRGAGGLPAGVTFPVMANFAVFNEFLDDRRHQTVAAVRAFCRGGEAASARELCLDMKLHDFGLLSSSAVDPQTGWLGVAANRGDAETL